MKVLNTNDQSIPKLKILIHGESGNGKTTLAGTVPGKCLVISSEAGLLSLYGKDVDFIDLTKGDDNEVIPKEKRVGQLLKAYHYLLTPECIEKYEWVFIDSLTEISQNLMEALHKEFPERRDSLVMYGENAKRMRSIIKVFRDIPHYHVVFTALSTIEKDENNKRFKGIDVVGKISNQLPAFFDEVFYMALNKGKEGNTERFLVTASDRAICKDRSGKLERYTLPCLSGVYNKIFQTTKEVKND